MSEKEVLIVEDHEAVHKLIRRSFEKFDDYNVTCSHTYNGEQGLEFLKNNDRIPDLVIVDRHMPVMSGDEFITTLRQEEKFKDLPLMILSAMNSVQDIVDGLDGLKANEYMTKPFSTDEFLIRVKKILLIADSQKSTIESNKKLSKKVSQLNSMVFKSMNEVSFLGEILQLSNYNASDLSEWVYKVIEFADKHLSIKTSIILAGEPLTWGSFDKKNLKKVLDAIAKNERITKFGNFIVTVDKELAIIAELDSVEEIDDRLLDKLCYLVAVASSKIKMLYGKNSEAKTEVIVSTNSALELTSKADESGLFVEMKNLGISRFLSSFQLKQPGTLSDEEDIDRFLRLLFNDTIEREEINKSLPEEILFHGTLFGISYNLEIDDILFDQSTLQIKFNTLTSETNTQNDKKDINQLLVRGIFDREKFNDWIVQIENQFSAIIDQCSNASIDLNFDFLIHSFVRLYSLFHGFSLNEFAKSIDNIINELKNIRRSSEKLDNELINKCVSKLNNVQNSFIQVFEKVNSSLKLFYDAQNSHKVFISRTKIQNILDKINSISTKEKNSVLNYLDQVFSEKVSYFCEELEESLNAEIKNSIKVTPDNKQKESLFPFYRIRAIFPKIVSLLNSISKNNSVSKNDFITLCITSSKNLKSLSLQIPLKLLKEEFQQMKQKSYIALEELKGILPEKDFQKLLILFQAQENSGTEIKLEKGKDFKIVISF